MSEMCHELISMEETEDSRLPSCSYNNNNSNIMEINSCKEDDVNTPYMSPCSSFSSYDTCFSYLDDTSFDIEPDLDEEGIIYDQLENGILEECTESALNETPLQFSDEITDKENFQNEISKEDLNKTILQSLPDITETINISTEEDFEHEINDKKEISKEILNETPLQFSNEITDNIEISNGEEYRTEISEECSNESLVPANSNENIEAYIEEIEKIKEEILSSLHLEESEALLEEFREETGTELKSGDSNSNETVIEENQRTENDEECTEIGTGPSLSLEEIGTENEFSQSITDARIKVSETETGTGTDASLSLEEIGTENELSHSINHVKSEISETGSDPSVVEEICTENKEEINIGTETEQINIGTKIEQITIGTETEPINISTEIEQTNIGTTPLLEEPGTETELSHSTLQETETGTNPEETRTETKEQTNAGTDDELSHSTSNKTETSTLNQEEETNIGTAPLLEDLGTGIPNEPSSLDQTIPHTNLQKPPLHLQSLPSKPLEPYHSDPAPSSYLTDPETWSPPLPSSSEPDETSLTNSSDSSDSEDNISINGIKLTKSSDFDGTEERERSMLTTMNGEFRELVRRFMRAEGFEVEREGEEREDEWEGDSWQRLVRVMSWQAGLMVKPDAGAGKEMDPGMYVKVKCVASGSRSQSEVVNGLVFKKSASHKHMPTVVRNPRILLLKEVLGHSVAGLSSIKSMEQDMDVLEKSIKSILETCKPDIILVQNSASREVQEILLKQGITVILDMKSHRMDRIVRCTGSTVVSVHEALTRPDASVWTCGSFRIERFEGSRGVSKNLLFLEGMPKPLGCTILLRGGTIEELKRIKRILNYTVFAAYHLILVTSFFADQRLFANYKMALKEENSIIIPPISVKPTTLRSESSTASTASTQLDLDVHISDTELPLCPLSNNNNVSSNYLVSSDVPLRVNSAPPDINWRKEDRNRSERTRVRANPNLRNPNLEVEDSGDSRSILIIVSSRNIAKRTICENSHISRINYYGTSDRTLGTHLQDILLNENHKCSSCNDPPSSHSYSFTHFHGRLTVLVSSLPSSLNPKPSFPPPSKNSKKLSLCKIWMWTRCLGCRRELGRMGPTERFLVSDSARNLSFGKFLELSFSSRLAEKKMPCGHLLHRDGLRFFGMGRKVAMFRYSPVALFNASKPPSMLDFGNSKVQDWLQIETLDVCEKRAKLFAEVERIANDLQESCSDPDFLKEISLDSLLSTQARFPLEASLTNKTDFSSSNNNNINSNFTKQNISIEDVLSLNWLYQTLFLETYMWDQRLNHLLQNRKAPPPFSNNYEKTQNKDTNSDIWDNSQTKETELEITQVPELPLLQKSESAPESILSLDLTNPKTQTLDRNEWIWAPFNNVLMAYKKELQVGFLERFQLVNNYKPSTLRIQNRELESRFFIGPGGNVFSVSEDDVSSLIAYALCIQEESRKNEEETKADQFPLTNLLSATSSISSDEFLSISKDLHPEISLNKVTNNFLSLKLKHSITCVFFRQFHELRKKCCPSEIAYITSLSRGKKWNAQGGKSKVFFAKTMDERFIIKQIKRTEFDSFLQFAPDYFKYVSESVERGNPSCLAKILGIYQVCEVRNGKEIRTDLMVMENLLFNHSISRTYDLKGAVFARHVADSDSPNGGSGKVFLDQNFIEDMRASPIYLGQKTKKLLERALWNDTSFLTAINVMDYSLLVGVDKENRTLIFGIIDYLRQYTWDKQLETWVKSSLVVPKNELPTVISPKEYKKRFRKFMQQQILSVPEGWGDEN